MKASADDDWLHSFDTSTPGTLSFIAEANHSENERRTTVRLNYDRAEEVEISVTQAAASEPQSAPFDIEITETGTNIVKWDIVPEDEDMLYINMLCSKSVWDEFENDEALFQSDLAYFKSASEYLGLSLEEALSRVFLQKGTQTDCFVETGLKPENEYVVYAYGMNLQGERTTGIAHSVATTKQVEIIDMTFRIETEATDISADVEITASDDTIRFYYDLTTKADFDRYGNSAEFASATAEEMVAYFRSLDLSIEEGVNMVSARSTASHQFTRLSPDTEYTVYAFAWDKYGNVVSECATQTVRTEPRHSPAECTFAFDVTDIGPRTASITVMPSDRTILYWWDLFETGTTEEQAAAELAEELKGWVESPVGASGYFDIYGKTGESSKEFQMLSPETGYKAGAVAIIAETGELAAPFRFSEVFTTDKAPVANVGIEVSGKYYDGDALADADQDEFGWVRGWAYAVWTTTTDAEKFYMWPYVYEEGMEDPVQYPDEEIIKRLVGRDGMGTSPLLMQYTWGSKIIVLAVAKDADGNFSEVFREIVTFDKEGASPVSDLVPGATSAERFFSDAKCYERPMPGIIRGEDADEEPASISENIRTEGAPLPRFRRAKIPESREAQPRMSVTKYIPDDFR